jgi:hypothetical protein
MGDSLQHVMDQALMLPVQDRQRIIETLQHSLDASVAENERAWIPVLQERSEKIRLGISVPKEPEILRQFREKRREAGLG